MGVCDWIIDPFCGCENHLQSRVQIAESIHNAVISPCASDQAVEFQEQKSCCGLRNSLGAMLLISFPALSQENCQYISVHELKKK